MSGCGINVRRKSKVRDIPADSFHPPTPHSLPHRLRLLLPLPKGSAATNPLLSSPIAFAACALNRTFSVSFVCREPLRVMNSCMKLHANPQEHDAAREDWFAQRQERVQAKIEKQRRKEEQARFVREWWGLEESEREAEIRRVADEKLRRGERVGGYRPRPRGEGEGGQT